MLVVLFVFFFHFWFSLFFVCKAAAAVVAIYLSKCSNVYSLIRCLDIISGLDHFRVGNVGIWWVFGKFVCLNFFDKKSDLCRLHLFSKFIYIFDFNVQEHCFIKNGITVIRKMGTNPVFQNV